MSFNCSLSPSLQTGVVPHLQSDSEPALGIECFFEETRIFVCRQVVTQLFGHHEILSLIQKTIHFLPFWFLDVLFGQSTGGQELK